MAHILPLLPSALLALGGKREHPRCSSVRIAYHFIQLFSHSCQSQGHFLSPDVNECKIYGQEGRPRLCMHACVNTPGSYRCTCPSGYRIMADGKSCEGE